MVDNALDCADGRCRPSWLSQTNGWAELCALMNEATPKQLGGLLWHAASYGCLGATVLLLEAGASPNESRTPGGRDALQETCVWGWGASLQIVQMLLRQDADINRKASLKGRLLTALEMAQQKQHTELADAILDWDMRFTAPRVALSLPDINSAGARSRSPRRKARLGRRRNVPRHTGQAPAAPLSPVSRSRSLSLDYGCSPSLRTDISINEVHGVAAAANVEAPNTLVQSIANDAVVNHNGEQSIGNSNFDLQIHGFALDGNFYEASHSSEQDWDQLRAFVMERTCVDEVKEESESDQEREIDAACITLVDVDSICFLQPSIGRRFRDGRELQDTIVALRTGQVDVNSDPRFVLNVAMAKVRQRHGHTNVVYYTMDHRRLYCMRRAGCEQARVSVKLFGHWFNEFVRKATERLGRTQCIRPR